MRKRCSTGEFKFEARKDVTADATEALKLIKERAAEVTLMKPYLKAHTPTAGHAEKEKEFVELVQARAKMGFKIFLEKRFCF